jgi:hypothetical protein
MPKRLLPRDEVHRRLIKLKCKPVKEYETTTAWETASGVWFSVPHEGPEQHVDEDLFREAVLEVESWNLFTGKKPL